MLFVTIIILSTNYIFDDGSKLSGNVPIQNVPLHLLICVLFESFLIYVKYAILEF